MSENEAEARPSEIFNERIKVLYFEASEPRSIYGRLEPSSLADFVAIRRADGRVFLVPIRRIIWIASAAGDREA